MTHLVLPLCCLILRTVATAMKRPAATGTVEVLPEPTNFGKTQGPPERQAHSKVKDDWFNSNDTGGPINPHEFNITLQPTNPCKQTEDLFILAIVHSAPTNLKSRMFIRRTWGSLKWFPRTRLRVVFALGKPYSPQLQKALELEASTFNDILQEDFRDTYRNLTLKSIMWLRWIPENCPSAPYILKTDDDMFINIFGLVNHLKSMATYDVINSTNTIICSLTRSANVKRENDTKWAVSSDEVPFDTYGMHCPGLAYVLTTDLAQQLYQESLRTKFFWIDDIYVTGFLTERLGNVTFYDMRSLYSMEHTKHHERNRDGTVIFALEEDLNRRYALWYDLLRMRNLKQVTQP